MNLLHQFLYLFNLFIFVNSFSPQHGCNTTCITKNLNTRVLIRAKNIKCCGETKSLRMGTFQTLGILQLQRQIDLSFGYTTSITYQTNATHYSAPLTNDTELLNTMKSTFSTRIWFQTNKIPLVEVTIYVKQMPSQVVGLALGGEHLTSYIWQLASRENGDPLAKVDVRLDRLLVGDRLIKKDVGVEIPRGESITESQSTLQTLQNQEEDEEDLFVPSAIPIASRRVVVGILIDVKKKYLKQAIRWLTSWSKTMLKEHNEVKVLVCVLPGVSKRYQLQLKQTFPFIHLRSILPLTQTLPGATPHSNKLRFLEQPECNNQSNQYVPSLHHTQYDVCIYMDTDILILNSDLLTFIKPEPVLQFRAGRTLWSQAASSDPIWHRMFELAGVIRTKHDTYPLAKHWPNTGILIFPTSIIPHFLYTWMHYTDKAMRWLKTLQQDVYFTETISFLLTMLMTKNLNYELLPIQTNCQMNLPKLDFVRNGYDTSLELLGDVTVLHYPLDTLLMNQHHIPIMYKTETIEDFPFLKQVNHRIKFLKSAFTKTMLSIDTSESSTFEGSTNTVSNTVPNIVIQLVLMQGTLIPTQSELHASPNKCRTFSIENNKNNLLEQIQKVVGASKGGLRWMDIENDWIDVMSNADIIEAMEVTTMEMIPCLMEKNEENQPTPNDQLLQLLFFE